VRHVAFDVRVDEGAVYRLGGITFRNAAPGNVVTLFKTSYMRSLFALRDGDILEIGAVNRGIEKLKEAYANFGYIDTAAELNAETDEVRRRVNLAVALDEGKSYRIASIDILGLTDNVQKRLVINLRPGDYFNSRLTDLVFIKNRRLLPPESNRERNLALLREPTKGIVHMTFDFRRCPGELQSTSVPK
jgi:outer membrane protein assembly factor BamA